MKLKRLMNRLSASFSGVIQIPLVAQFFFLLIPQSIGVDLSDTRSDNDPGIARLAHLLIDAG